MSRLTLAVETLTELESLAASMGMAASLTIYGHADATGTEKRNYEISQNRAKAIAAMLYAKGSSMPIALYGMGAEYADTEKGKVGHQASRRIELKVRLVQAGSPDLNAYPLEE
jgi:outer membrane protein OmpA-like peptidoglycan-associated protein